MKVLADENVPRVVVGALRTAGHDVAWIAEIAPGLRDLDVLAKAAAEWRLLITLDKDFGELAFSVGLPAESGVLLVRAHGLSAQQLATLVKGVLGDRDDWRARFAVLTAQRLRVREMPEPTTS